MILYFCLECLGEFPIELMKKGTKKSQCRRGVCKKCNSIKSHAWQIETMAKSFPDKFMDCDECDRTFNKYVPGTNNKAKSLRPLRTECPYCYSEEIHPY